MRSSDPYASQSKPGGFHAHVGRIPQDDSGDNSADRRQGDDKKDNQPSFFHAF